MNVRNKPKATHFRVQLYIFHNEGVLCYSLRKSADDSDVSFVRQYNVICGQPREVTDLTMIHNFFLTLELIY